MPIHSSTVYKMIIAKKILKTYTSQKKQKLIIKPQQICNRVKNIKELRYKTVIENVQFSQYYVQFVFNIFILFLCLITKYKLQSFDLTEFIFNF